MWTIETLSAERYRPLLTASKRKQLLEPVENLSRKERQRLRQIAVAGIYDLQFLLYRLPDKDQEQVFSNAKEPHEDPIKDQRLPRFQAVHEMFADDEAWNPPSRIEYKSGVQERISEVDSSIDLAATLAVLERLDMDPKLDETTSETRSELFKPLTQIRRFNFDRTLAALFGVIEDGLDQNDITGDQLLEQVDRPPFGKYVLTQDLERLQSFEADLDNLAGGGSLISDIEEQG